ncbi:hypothetical protein ILYODFUR_032729 [Ilyodon furcidens]|uniref:Uncharacterized protein n=1 Tax=Ilyodon furcidens TaxID=33524 RepID=A0ABV0T3V5_9TELE
MFIGCFWLALNQKSISLPKQTNDSSLEIYLIQSYTVHISSFSAQWSLVSSSVQVLMMVHLSRLVSCLDVNLISSSSSLSSSSSSSYKLILSVCTLPSVFRSTLS